MNKTNITVLLAIPMPSNEFFEKDDKQRHRTDLYTTLDELSSLSGVLDFPLFEYGTHSPSIELLDRENSNQAQMIRHFDEKIIEQCEFLRFSIDVPCPSLEKLNQLYNQREDNGGVNLFSIFIILSRKFFIKRIVDLLVMVNLSRVGSIEVSDSFLIQDGKVEFSEIPKIYTWSLQKALIFAESIGWPQLNVFEILQVWNWAINHKDFIDGFSKNAMGRALNAFSRMLDKANDDGPMILFWALVGIEALYINGKVALIEQVKEKSQILLGPQETFKSKIGQMYDFRSRFIHGDLDFPPLYLIGEASDNVVKYDDELDKSTIMASAILIATIQEIIKRNWDGLQFTYSVNNS